MLSVWGDTLWFKPHQQKSKVKHISNQFLTPVYMELWLMWKQNHLHHIVLLNQNEWNQPVRWMQTITTSLVTLFKEENEGTNLALQINCQVATDDSFDDSNDIPALCHGLTMPWPYYAMDGVLRHIVHGEDMSEKYCNWFRRPMTLESNSNIYIIDAECLWNSWGVGL